MGLEVKVHNGVVARWDSVHHGDHVTYASLEFEGGKRLAQFMVEQGLNDILEPALKAGMPVKLHVVTPIHTLKSAVVAFSDSSGHLFATDLPPLPYQWVLKVILILSILLVPIFGVGFITFGMWVNLRMKIQPFLDLRKYLDALPGATMIKPS